MTRSFRPEHPCPYVKQYIDPANGNEVSGVICYEDDWEKKGCIGCGFHPEEIARRNERGKTVEFFDERYPDNKRITRMFRRLDKK